MKNIFKTSMMALAGLALFTACEDDRDSNPILNTSGDVEFVLNTPEFASQNVLLGSTETLQLTWSQPVLTNNNAPLGTSGVYGLVYQIQVSKDGNFTKSFAEALAEVETDEEGNYLGTPEGCDYAAIETLVSGCTADVNSSDLNVALNKAYMWSMDDALTAVKPYVRVVALWAKSNGTYQVLAKSNAHQITVTPSSWVDIMAKPVEASYLWVPGGGNGWSHAVAPILVSEDGEIYQGYAYLDGEFKFTLADNWNDGELNNGSFDSASANIDLGDQGGGNIVFTGDASMCFITLNLTEKTLDVTPVKWGIVGGFNSWSVDDGKIVDMTYNTDAHCLEATVEGLTGEWKFARDNSWTYNFGGSLDALEQDGPNLTDEGSTVQLFIERPSVDGYHAVVK